MKREKALKILRDCKRELEKRYGVTKLGIFGSVARDKSDADSDVDVVVEMAPNLFRMVSLKEDLEKVFGTKVDLVRYWRRMNHYLKKRIDREGVYV